MGSPRSRPGSVFSTLPLQINRRLNCQHVDEKKDLLRQQNYHQGMSNILFCVHLESLSTEIYFTSLPDYLFMNTFPLKFRLRSLIRVLSKNYKNKRISKKLCAIWSMRRPKSPLLFWGKSWPVLLHPRSRGKR